MTKSTRPGPTTQIAVPYASLEELRAKHSALLRRRRAERRDDGYDLRLMSPVEAESDIPTVGEGLIIVADVRGTLHFRIFEADGRRAVDTDESELAEKAAQITELKQILGGLWQTPQLTQRDKDRVGEAATSIVGHTRRDEKSFLDEVAAFMARGHATGAVLGGDDERYEAQSLLIYWSNVLYRAGRVTVDDTLAEYDPSLATPLDESDYPYADLGRFPGDGPSRTPGWHRLIDQALKDLDQNKLVAVVGVPGSGRTDLVHNGLLPALRGGALNGSKDWVYSRPITPDDAPLTGLVRALNPVASEDSALAANKAERLRRDPGKEVVTLSAFGDRPVVIVAERFEEQFKRVDKGHIRAFVRAIVALTELSNVKHLVLLAMHPETLSAVTGTHSQFAGSDSIRERFQSGLIVVTFNSAELREMIEGPAKFIGLKFDDGVVERLLLDVQGDPAALSLLRFSLRRLWDHRQGNRITHEVYDEWGGGRFGVARWAERYYEGLSHAEQGAARALLLRMVLPESGFGIRCPRIPESRLLPTQRNQETERRVLDELLRAGLVLLIDHSPEGEARYTIVHEAIATAWPRFLGWLDEIRDRHRWRIQLREATEQWQSQGRSDDALWRGAILALVLEDARRLEADGDRLDDNERAFLVRSGKAEANRKRIRQAILPVGILLIALIAILLSWQRAEFEKQRAEFAETNRKLSILRRSSWLLENGVQQGSRGWDTAGAFLSYVESWKSFLDSKDVKVLRESDRERLDRNHHLRLGIGREQLPRMTGMVYLTGIHPKGAFARSADGGRVVAVGGVYDLRLMSPVEAESDIPTVGESLIIVADVRGTLHFRIFEADGRRAVDTDENETKLADKAVQIGELKQLLSEMGQAPQLSQSNKDRVRNAVASIVGHTQGVEQGLRQVQVKVWQRGDGAGEDFQEVANFWWTTPLGEQRFEILDAQISREGAVVVLARNLHESTGGSEVGKEAAYVWEDPTKKQEPKPICYKGQWKASGFSPDGRFFAIASTLPKERSKVTLWDVHASWKDLELDDSEPRGEPPVQLAFSQDGGRLAVAGLFDPEEKDAADASKAVCLEWSTNTLGVRRRYSPRRQDRPVLAASDVKLTCIAYGKEGQNPLLFVGGQEGENSGNGWLFETGPRMPACYELKDYKELKGPIRCAEFNRTGDRLATGNDDGTAVIWDLRSGEPPSEITITAITSSVSHRERIFEINFSPDGQYIVTASRDRRALVCDSETGELVYPSLHHHGSVAQAWFTEDGRHLVSRSEDAAHLWELAPRAQRLELSPPLTAASYMSDTAHVLAWGQERQEQEGGASGKPQGWVRVWDAGTQRDKSPLHHSFTGTILHAAINPDDREIYVVSLQQDTDTVRAFGHLVIERRELDDSGQDREMVRSSTIEAENATTTRFTRAAFSPKFDRLAVIGENTATKEGVLLLCDLISGHHETLKGAVLETAHKETILHVGFSHDGERIVTTGQDDKAFVWRLSGPDGSLEFESVKPKELKDTLKGEPLSHSADVEFAAFHPTEKVVVTASRDGSAIVWPLDLDQDRKRDWKRIKLVHDGPVARALFGGPNNSLVITVELDGIARIWDPVDGQLIGMKPHQGWPLDVRYQGGEDPGRIVVLSALGSGGQLMFDSWLLTQVPREADEGAFLKLGKVLSGRQYDSGDSVYLLPRLSRMQQSEVYNLWEKRREWIEASRTTSSRHPGTTRIE